VVVGSESRSNTATGGGLSALVHVTNRNNLLPLCRRRSYVIARRESVARA
jgi:hypothetical protein